jgi:hypothetical protein
MTILGIQNWGIFYDKSLNNLLFLLLKWDLRSTFLKEKCSIFIKLYSKFTIQRHINEARKKALIENSTVNKKINN